MSNPIQAVTVAPEAQKAVVDVFGANGLTGLALLAMLIFTIVLAFLLIRQSSMFNKLFEASTAADTARTTAIQELARISQAAVSQSQANGAKLDTITAFIGGKKDAS